jgi:hypothetical protein
LKAQCGGAALECAGKAIAIQAAKSFRTLRGLGVTFRETIVAISDRALVAFARYLG